MESLSSNNESRMDSAERFLLLLNSLPTLASLPESCDDSSNSEESFQSDDAETFVDSNP